MTSNSMENTPLCVKVQLLLINLKVTVKYSYKFVTLGYATYMCVCREGPSP